MDSSTIAGKTSPEPLDFSTQLACDVEDMWRNVESPELLEKDILAGIPETCIPCGAPIFHSAGVLVDDLGLRACKHYFCAACAKLMGMGSHPHCVECQARACSGLPLPDPTSDPQAFFELICVPASCQDGTSRASHAQPLQLSKSAAFSALCAVLPVSPERFQQRFSDSLWPVWCRSQSGTLSADDFKQTGGMLYWLSSHLHELRAPAWQRGSRPSYIGNASDTTYVQEEIFQTNSAKADKIHDIFSNADNGEEIAMGRCEGVLDREEEVSMCHMNGVESEICGSRSIWPSMRRFQSEADALDLIEPRLRRLSETGHEQPLVEKLSEAGHEQAETTSSKAAEDNPLPQVKTAQTEPSRRRHLSVKRSSKAEAADVNQISRGASCPPRSARRRTATEGMVGIDGVKPLRTVRKIRPTAKRSVKSAETETPPEGTESLPLGTAFGAKLTESRDVEVGGSEPLASFGREIHDVKPKRLAKKKLTRPKKSLKAEDEDERLQKGLALLVARKLPEAPQQELGAKSPRDMKSPVGRGNLLDVECQEQLENALRSDSGQHSGKEGGVKEAASVQRSKRFAKRASSRVKVQKQAAKQSGQESPSASSCAPESPSAALESPSAQI